MEQICENLSGGICPAAPLGVIQVAPAFYNH